MPGSEERLQQSGRHVAIVGAFSVVNDDSERVRTVSFREAPEAINFSLLAQREESDVNGVHPFMSLRIKTPAQSAGVEGTTIPISGTALESELLKIEGSPDPAAIGGKIVVDLMKSLDAQAPFWDPNFDVLLTEAFYFSRVFRRGDGETIGGVALHEVLYEPGFNRLLTAYLRAPGEDADEIFELAKDAFPGETFRSGTAGEGLVKLRDDLLQHMRDLRAWLNQTTDGAGQRGQFAVLHNADIALASEFDQKLRGLLIQGHRGKSLKEMYAAFREARDSVTQIARSEPLMAFVTNWFFSAFSPSDDPRKVSEQVFQTLYLEKGWKPTNIDAELEKDLFEVHAKQLRELHAKRFGESDSPAARASNNLIETTITEWARLRQPGRVFRTDQLLAEMGRLFLQLNEKFIPGMEQIRELIDEAMKLVHKAEQEVDANFQLEDENGQLVDATAKLLDAKLAPIFKSLDEIFAESQAKKSVEKPTSLDLAKTLEVVLRGSGKVTGKALSVAVLKAIAKQAAEIESSVMEPLSKNQDEINQRGEELEKAVIAEWKGAMNSGGLVAGGTAGITGEDIKKDNIEKRAETLPQVARLAAGLSVELPSRKSKDSPLNAPDNPAASFDPKKGLNINLPLTQEELLESVKPEEREAVAGVLKPVWERLAKAQSEVLKAKREVMADNDFLNVAGAPSEAERRALLRALLLGEHFLAAPESASVLNKQDTSIFPKILFECMRWVGRRSEFEGTGRVALLKPSVSKDPGFADIPLKDMLQVKSAEEGAASIANFLAYARREAQRVLDLRDYLADMKDVKDLVEELGKSGDGYVTIVNDTIDSRGKLAPTELEPIYEVSDDAADFPFPPPAIVYVTRQAFSDRFGSSLAPIEQKLFDGKNSHLSGGKGQTRLQTVKLERKIGFPLYVGRSLEAERLPFLAADVDRLGTLVLVLCGVARLSDQLDAAWERIQSATGVMAGKRDTYPEFWRRFLSDEKVGPVIRSKLVAHAITTRQNEGKAPEFLPSLIEAVNETASKIGADESALRARTWFVHADRWSTLPPSATGLPHSTAKFVISPTKPDNPLTGGDDPLFDLL